MLFHPRRTLILLAALFSLGFNHHARVTVKASAGAPAWANTYSCRYAGTSTADAGRTNFGQPAPWCVRVDTNAISFSFWFRSNTGGANNADGALLTSADQSTNSHMRLGTSGTTINQMFAGGQSIFTPCAAVISANTWTLVTMAFTGTDGVRLYVGNSSTSCIGAFGFVDPDVCTRDFFFNTLRASTNADTAFGEWGTPNLDELTVWNTELSGTDHVALISSGHAVNPTTHAKAANLVSYVRCGDDAGDTSGTVQDVVGNFDGTHSGSAGVTYEASVP